MKELQSFGLIEVTLVVDAIILKPLKMQEMFNLVVEGGRKREIDPTLTLLRDLYIEAKADTETDAEVKKRIADVLDFLEVMTRLLNKQSVTMLQRGNTADAKSFADYLGLPLQQLQFPITTPWLLSSIGLYLLAGTCWLSVVVVQNRKTHCC